MSQPDPGAPVIPAVTVPAASRQPGSVTAAAVSMLLLAVVGLVGSMVALVEHLSRSLQVSLLLDFELQQNLLAVVLCVIVAALALGVWSGSSAARLGAFAALGVPVIVAAARTVAHLAAVLYGIDAPYEEPWREALVLMWLYLAATAVLAVPIVLLNRSTATRWFRDRRPGAQPFADLEAGQAPPVLFLARMVLGMAVLLIVFLTVWNIFELAAGDYIKPGATTELIIASFVAATVPLLVLTAAIVEAGSGSRLGQVAAFMSTGYAIYLGHETLYKLFAGLWLANLQQFGAFLTTAAIGVAGLVALFLLLRPSAVDHFARQAVVLDLGAALEEIALAEAEADDEDEDDSDAPETD